MNKYALDKQTNVINNFRRDINTTPNETIDGCIERGIKLREKAEANNRRKNITSDLFTNASLPAPTLDPLTQAIFEGKKITKADRVTNKLATIKLVTVDNGKGWNPNRVKFSFDKSFIPNTQVASAIVRAFRKMAAEIGRMKGKNKIKAIAKFELFTTPKNASKEAKKLNTLLENGAKLKPEFDLYKTVDYKNAR